MATVNLSPVFNGYQSFLANGQPNALGFINTYQAGSSTPLATYTTSAGSVQNALSIPLSASGVPPNEIWLVAGSAYKFVVTDASSNILGTYDNIVGVNDSSINLGSVIHAATSKTTPTGLDEVAGTDSANSYSLVKFTFTNLANYFSSLCSAGWNALTATTATNATNATNLLNTASPQLPTITATQGTGAITVGASSQYLDFRDPTLTSGTVHTLVCAPASLIIRSGDTLGTPTTLTARLQVVELYNGGTPVLGVINGTVDESQLYSSLPLSGSANVTINQIYTASGITVSNSPVRVIGFFDSVNTAGAWGNPTVIQGISAPIMNGFGYGQTYQTVTRTSGTTYYNTTGKMIEQWRYFVAGGSDGYSTMVINGSITLTSVSCPVSNGFACSWRIPSGASYVATDTNVGSGLVVTELR